MVEKVRRGTAGGLERKLEKLVGVVQERSKEDSGRRMVVRSSMRQVLRYFLQYDVYSFLSTADTAGLPSYVSTISKQAGVKPSAVRTAISRLEHLGILGEEKGLSSPGGAEYYFGLKRPIREYLVRGE